MTMTNSGAPLLRRRLGTLLLLGLLALGIHDIFGAHGYLAMRRAEKQAEQLQSDIDRLNRENRELSGQVRALKTDPETIERVAREEMGLARPGEMIFKLPAKPVPGDSSHSPHSSP